MTPQPYHEPVSKLLALGRPKGDWLDYPALGLSQADIPELMRMAQDNELRFMEPPEDLPNEEDLPEWYAPIHAWRALAQLGPDEATIFILDILRKREEEDDDDDWLPSDAPHLFALIGPSAIPALATFLTNRDNPSYARATVGESLEEMAKAHPETREACITPILTALKSHANNDEEMNGFLIANLLELGAGLENIALIEEVFETDNVDPFVTGDLEDVKIELGLLEERTTPRKRPDWFLSNEMKELAKEVTSIITKQKKKAQKEKNKRKQEKKSRKKNRKKGK
jgi:hypothetical protein